MGFGLATTADFPSTQNRETIKSPPQIATKSSTHAMTKSGIFSARTSPVRVAAFASILSLDHLASITFPAFTPPPIAAISGTASCPKKTTRLYSASNRTEEKHGCETRKRRDTRDGRL